MIPNVVEHVGDVVVIRRNGKDGGRFPLRNSATIGRSESCDIRIQLQYVSRKHAELSIANEKVVLTNCSSVNPIMVNGEPVDSTIVLRHMDIFSIGDRAFRFEYFKPFHSDDEVNDEDPDRTCQLDPGVLPVAIRARMSGGMHMRPPRPPTTAGHSPLKSKVSAENVAANEQALASDAHMEAVKKTPGKKPQSAAAKVQPQQVSEDQVGIEEQPANPTRHSLMSQSDVDRLVDDLVEGMRTSLRLSTPIRKDIESRRFSPASRGAHVPIADKENAEPDDMAPPSATRARLATPVRRAIESRLQSYPPWHPPATAAAATTRTAVTANQQQQPRKPLPTPIKEAIQSRRWGMPTPRKHHEQDYPQQQEAEGVPTDARDSVADAVEPHASASPQQSLPTPMRQEIDARRRSYTPHSAAAADPAATDDKLDAPAFTQPARRMSTRSSAPSAAEARASAVVSASEAAVEAVTAEPQEDGEEEEGRHPLEVTQRGWQRSSALPTLVRREIDARRRSYVAPRRLSVEHVQEVVEEQPVCEGEVGEEDVVDDDEPRLTNRAPLPTPVKRAIHSRRRSSYAVEPALPTVDEAEGEAEDDFNAAFTALRAMNITPAAPRTTRPRRGFAAGTVAADAREGSVDSHASTPYKHDPASTRVSSVGPVGVPGTSASRTPAVLPHQARLATPIRTAIDARRLSYAAPVTTQTALHSRGRYGLLDEESEEDGEEDDGEVTLGGSHQAEIFSDVIGAPQLHAEEDEADEREELVVEEGEAKDSSVDQRVMTVTRAVSRNGGSVAVKAQQADDASDEAAQHVTRSMCASLARDINSRRQSYRTRSASADEDAAVRHNDAAIKAQLDEDGEDGLAEDAFGDQRGNTVTPAGRGAQPQAATRRRLSVDMHADGAGMDNDTALRPPVAAAIRQSFGGAETDDAATDHRDTRTEHARRVTRARPQSPRPPLEGAPTRRSMTGAFVPSPVRSIAHSDDDVYEEELNNDAFIEQRDMDFTLAVAHRPRIFHPRRTGHDDSDAFSEQRMMAVTPAVARTIRAREVARRASQRAMRGMEGEHGSVEDAYADARMMTVTPMMPRTRSRRAPQTAEDDAFSEQRHMAFTPAPLPVRRSSRQQQPQASVRSQAVPPTPAHEVDDNPFLAQRDMTVTPAVPRRTTRRQQHTPAPAEGGGTVDPQVAPAAIYTPAMPTRSSTRRQQQQLQTPSLAEQVETVAMGGDEASMPLRSIPLTPAIVDRWRQQLQREYASVKEGDISESDLELPNNDTLPKHRNTVSTPAVPTRRSTRGQLSNATHFKLQGAEAVEEEEGDPYSEHRNMAFTPAVPTRRHTRSQRKAPAVSKSEAEAVDEEDHDPFTEQRNMAVTPAVPVRRSNLNNRFHDAPKADGDHETNDEEDDDAFESLRAMAVTPAVAARRNNVRIAAARPRTASCHHAAANGDAYEDADPFAEHRAMTVTPMPRRVTRSAAAAAAPARAAAAAFRQSGDGDDDEVIRAMANTPWGPLRERAQRPLPTAFRRSGASRRSGAGGAREQRHDNGDVYTEDGREEGDAFEEQRVMAVTPAVQRDGRPVRPRAQRPVSETFVRVSDEMDAEEKGTGGDVASEQFSVGEHEGNDDAFVEHRAMAGYTPAAPVKRPSIVRGKADAYAEEEGEAEKPTQRRRSLLDELGESNRIEEELASGAEEAADLRMLQAVTHAMSRDSGVETGAAFSAAMDAFLEDPPRFRHEAQPIVDQHDSDAAGGQTSIEEVEGMAARDGISSEDVQSSGASPPSDGQVSREPETDDDDGEISPPQQQQQCQEGSAGAEQGRLSTTDGDRTESNSTAESSHVMPAYVREDLMAVREAAEALRGDADGALSPSTAYDVAMDRYMEDPETFRRRMAAGNGLWSPGVDRATEADRPSGQGHISPLTGDSSPASASPAASGESQTFMQILKYLKTVRHSPNRDHGNEQDGVSQIKPQPVHAEPGGSLPTPMREGLAASLPAPFPPAVGSPEPRAPTTGREGGDHSSPFKGALATDLRLVELYAKEMAEVGRVPADYAWTVALDTYLADRGAFRQHLGSLLADVEAPSDSNEVQLPNGTMTDEDGDHVVGDAPSTQHSEGSNTEEEEEEGGHDSRHHSGDEESEDEVEEVAVPARGATSPNTRKTRTKRGRAAASSSTTTNRRTPIVSRAAGGATRKAPTTPSGGSMKKSAARTRALDRDGDDEEEDDRRVVAGRSPSPVVLTKRGTRKTREKGQSRNRQQQRQMQRGTQQEEAELSNAPREHMAGLRAPAVAEASSSSEADEEGEGGGEVLILCDGCDGEFALHEVGLTEVPEGDWYCGACRPKHTAAAKRATRRAVAAAAGGASDVQIERTVVRGKRATNSRKDTTTSTSARTRRAAAAAAATTSSSAPSTAERPKRSGRSVARAKGH